MNFKVVKTISLAAGLARTFCLLLMPELFIALHPVPEGGNEVRQRPANVKEAPLLFITSIYIWINLAKIRPCGLYFACLSL